MRLEKKNEKRDRAARSTYQGVFTIISPFDSTKKELVLPKTKLNFDTEIGEAIPKRFP